MEPTDITVQILQGIRGELQEMRGELRATREQQAEFQHEVYRRFEVVDERFEVVETTLRDLAQQMVLLARGIKVVIEDRARLSEKVDDHESRLKVIEERTQQ